MLLGIMHVELKKKNVKRVEFMEIFSLNLQGSNTTTFFYKIAVNPPLFNRVSRPYAKQRSSLPDPVMLYENTDTRVQADR